MLQTVFLRVLSGSEHEDAVRRPAAYFRRAAVNAAVDLLRRRADARRNGLRRSRRRMPPSSRGLLLKEQLRRAIATLESEDATLFVLRYVEGLSNQELADCSSSRRTTSPSGSTESGSGCRAEMER